MILYQYLPFSQKKIREVEAIEDSDNPEIISINCGTVIISGHLESLTKGGEYSLTPRLAIEARIEMQKRILDRETQLLAQAEEDLKKYPE